MQKTLTRLDIANDRLDWKTNTLKDTSSGALTNDDVGEEGGAADPHPQQCEDAISEEVAINNPIIEEGKEEELELEEELEEELEVEVELEEEEEEAAEAAAAAVVESPSSNELSKSQTAAVQAFKQDVLYVFSIPSGS